MFLILHNYICKNTKMILIFMNYFIIQASSYAVLRGLSVFSFERTTIN